MRILIVGNSVAGKSLVSLLARSKAAPLISSLHVVDNYAATESNASHFYTSLWSPSMRIILNQLNIPLETMKQITCSVEASGYRSVGGKWLAEPAKGLQLPPGFPSLSFIKNGDLLKLLDESSESLIKSNWRNKYFHHKGVSLEQLEMQSNGKINCTTSNGKTIEADIIVAADGMYSTVKKLITSRGNSNLEHRGYRVYRGILDKSLMSHKMIEELSYKRADASFKIKGFQTWGAGARFAVVPTNEGLAWYAAITCPEKYSFQSDEVMEPLVNGSKAVTSHDHLYLQAFFEKWHSPISEMIKSTKVNHIIATDAIASENIPTAPPGSSYHPEGRKTAVFFIGDALCTMDPILAQGTGLAIEDSWNVIQSLEQLIRDKPIVDHLTNADVQQVEHRAFALSKRRLQTLFVASNLAQGVGHLNSQLACNIRDLLLQCVPNAMKGVIFDKLIEETSR